MSMALYLGACSFSAQKDETPEPTEAPEVPQKIARARIKSVKSDGQELIPVSFSGSRFYCYSNEKIGEIFPENVLREARRKNKDPYNDGRYDVFEMALYRINLNGRIEKLEDYIQLPIEENINGWSDYSSVSLIDAVAVNDDGTLTSLEHTAVSGNSMPKNAADIDPQKDYLEYKINYYVRKLDNNGKELSVRSVSTEDALGMMNGGVFSCEEISVSGDSAFDKNGNPLFELSQCGIKRQELRSAIYEGNNGYRLMTGSYDRESKMYCYEVATVHIRDYYEADEFAVIKLGCMDNIISARLVNEVADFNRNNTAAVIIIKLLDNYDNTDCDILYLPYDESVRLGRSGALKDLSLFIKNDSVISEGLFLKGIFKAVKTDGKLFSTVAGFAINTVLGSENIVGKGCSWNFDDFRKVWQEFGAGTDAFDIYTAYDDIYSTLYYMDKGYYDSHSDAVSQLEFFCSNFQKEPDNAQLSLSDDVASDMRIQNGKQMLSQMTVNSFKDLKISGYEFNGEISFIGYPTDVGCGSYITVTTLDNGMNFSLTDNCRYDDIVWQFLRRYFTAPYQLEMAENEQFLPVNERIFMRLLKRSMLGEYAVDKFGNLVYDENDEPFFVSEGTLYLSNFKEIRYYPVSKEREEKFMTLINSISKTGGK